MFCGLAGRLALLFESKIGECKFVIGYWEEMEYGQMGDGKLLLSPRGVTGKQGGF